ncbi:MAG: glycosyl hydrolase family 95 catalytic domain-containing protein [Saccharofermentanales bacterium]
MNSNILSYKKPATEWVEGIPLGNGSIGAMFFGETGREQLTLNHDSLFRKTIIKDIRTAHLIPKMRELCNNGRFLEADQYFMENFHEKEEFTNPFQVFGELKFDIGLTGEFSDYFRTLDMSEGIARISYKTGNIGVGYESFVSKTDNSLIIKLVSTEKMKLVMELTRPVDKQCELAFDFKNGQLIMQGRFDEGITFASIAEINIFGGSAKWQADKLFIENSTQMIIRQVFSTSYVSADPMADCEAQLVKIRLKDFDSIKSDHIEENKRLYDRMSFVLEPDKVENEKTTGEIYDEIYDKKRIDDFLYMQLFNAGRYYMMSASRPGSYPMNLQGVWNDSIAPLWESGYTMDMNIQMQYWSSQVCNLSECELPVFDWLYNNRGTLERQAKNILGTRGYYIPQYTDIHFTPASYKTAGMFQLLWNSAAAWMGQHYYEYWKFTCDDDFLRNSAFPFMKQCAYLYKDFLVKDENGRYVSAPSYSPENRTDKGAWTVNTATMDITMAHELMSHLIEIDDYLKLGDPDRIWWEDINDNMADYPFDNDGNLMEWVSPDGVEDPYHRHISHIYGIFPGKLFSPENDKKLYDAAVKAIDKRHGGGYDSYATWSHAWFACCFARIGNGDGALESIDYLMKSGMCSNFLSLCNDWRKQGLTAMFVDYKLLQIEAMLGVTAAIAEMFIQSFDDGIKIMPSLPAKWRNGKITGLRTYGGFEFSIEWEESMIKRIFVKSDNGGKCVISLCLPFLDDSVVLEDQNGKILQKIADANSMDILMKGRRIVFDTIKSGSYCFR